MEENTPLPFKMKRFWACMKNKNYLQVLSGNIFQQMSENDSTKILLSGYAKDGEGTRPRFECTNNLLQRNNLEKNVEEADGKSVRHIWQVFKNGPRKICERQPLKNLKGYGLLKQIISLQIF